MGANFCGPLDDTMTSRRTAAHPGRDSDSMRFPEHRNGAAGQWRFVSAGSAQDAVCVTIADRWTVYAASYPAEYPAAEWRDE